MELSILLNNLDKIPEIFISGIRCILLIKRNKDGGKSNVQRNAIKRISHNSLEWKQNILELAQLRDNFYKEYRIYSSVNERNIKKAVHEFKRRQLEIDFGNLREFQTFYTDIENRFFSCLANPSCCLQKNFLVDCDNLSQIQNVLTSIPNELILMNYETKNGRHIITRPFNPNDYILIPNESIKKDGMMYIG